MSATHPERLIISEQTAREAGPPTRVRDPARKDRILSAAADLVARKGFHAVSISDIGQASGITGSGIYRHFDSKSAVLVALFDRAIDNLLSDEHQIVESVADLRLALNRLIDGQVEFVVADRELAQVYHNEINNLPDEDSRRLRRKQRMYIEEWVHLLDELREDLSDADARAVVHAAIGAIQSTLFHNTGLPEDRLRRLLADAARAVLGV
ncbi:MAG: transcriptional regulator, TetR family [Nocardia sp.]|uniref:TetR/AcrR family transcriptional regulator n=1 Tax=Nocardia sp. TaxID=1821 RepID=UPI0026093C62|nr:TetR/AcrR family transcriptional regulator [Nocardia sp.]MCU1647662.1 transcriptional regulator, TetR family [Nocardia sp.]